jgi:hypothetical protein
MLQRSSIRAGDSDLKPKAPEKRIPRHMNTMYRLVELWNENLTSGVGNKPNTATLLAGLQFATILRRKKAVRSLKKILAQQQGEGGSREATALERRVADILLRRPIAPLRFLIRLGLPAIKQRFGVSGISKVLAIALRAQDFALTDKCMILLASTQSPPRSYLLQDKSIPVGDAFITWLEDMLIGTAESIGECEPVRIDEFVQRASALLSDYVKGVGPERVGKIAAALGQISPENASLLALRGHCEKWNGNLEAARDLLARATADKLCDPLTYFELAEVLEFLEEDEAAIDAAHRGHELIAEADLFIKKASCLTMPAGPLMRQGRLKEGWERYQKRRDRLVFEAPSGREVWRGQSLGEETLFLIAEKGIGDEIRYASCYADLLKQVGSLAASADPRMVPLLQRSFPTIRFTPTVRGVVSGWKKKNLESDSFKLSRALTLELYCLAMQFDYAAMAGDVPLYLRREKSDFPKHQGYLVPDPQKREDWRERLDALGSGAKVGISWRSGTQTYKRDQHYFEISEMVPLLKTRGVHFINLQYDDCEQELDWVEDMHGVRVHRWKDTDLKDDLDGFAALLNELDLVIAPHTMVKEMAGAVGTPTLFMVPAGQAWVRWRAQGEKSADIWHPSVTHIQVTTPGDKGEVVAKTLQHLEKFVAARGQEELSPKSNSAYSSTQVARTAVVDAASDADNLTTLPVPDPTDTQVQTNEFGETYVRAGVEQFPKRAERDAEHARRIGDFQRVTSLLFDDTPQPADPRGVVLFSGLGSYKQGALTVLAAHGLMKRGWAVVPIDIPTFEPGKVRASHIHHFREILEPGTSKRLFFHRDSPGEFRSEWSIDLANKICSAEGLNFYPTIANRLGKEFRRYAVDYNDPAVVTRLRVLIKSCDAALAVCLDAEEQLASRGLPVRITGFETNYPTTGVFKVYCNERGRHHGIEFAEIRQAYEKYFRAGKSGFVRAVDAQNVTRHNLYSAAGLRGELFDDWFSRKRNDKSVIELAEGWVKQDRSGKGGATSEGEIVLERVRRHKAQGGKVACMYGCIPYDFGHPWPDRGPAHEDLRDWYNHCVATLSDTNVLLLIKPHPSEADFQQFGRPSEFFVEMLREPTAKNVSMLGHKWLNNSDLTPLLDFGIVWRGSIATELALMGVPVVISAPYSMVDQVLDFPMPKDRADFEHMLLNSEERITLTDELKRRASMVFAFYRMEQMIDYPFGWISSKRKDAGPPVLSEGAIRAYLRDGHPSIDEICRRIIADEEA